MTQNEVGSDNELMALVEKIKGFRYDDATASENFALARALKLVADDTLRRHEAVRQMQTRLREKLAVAEVAAELAGVIDALNVTPAAPAPKRAGFWR